MVDLSDDELQTLKDMLNVARALISSVSAAQITALAARIGELMPVLEAVLNPRVLNSLSHAGDDIADLIDLIISYHQSGTFKKALELITLASVLREALSTPTVEHLAASANDILISGNQLVGELQAVGGMGGLLAAAKKASLQAEQDQRAIGAVGLLRALKEPEVQKAIKFLLHFLKIVGKKA
jgi:uncharacterized protein YjgD (DUF1641 family)